MKLWKTVNRETVLKYDRRLVVEEHTIQMPDGSFITEWPWVITPDFVNIAAITEKGQFLCFRQTKYGVKGTTTLAPAGGYIEPRESPLEAAKRELLEETGYEALEWTPLGSYAVDGNRGAGMAHLFLARKARRVMDIQADDLEEQELLYLSQQKLETALAEGAFKVLPWATVLALALQYLKT